MLHGPEVFETMVDMIADAARTTDVAALALEYGDRVVLDSIRRTHARIARRAFGATRVVGSRVPESVHDALSSAVYETISRGLRSGGGAARSLASHGIGTPIEKTAMGRRWRATVNGLAGEQLRRASDPQAIVMTVRSRGVDVPASAWYLGQAHPEASSHVVVFVHGLCESEEIWRARQHPGLADAVDERSNATALTIRYNTGLSPGENGTHLSALLSQVVHAWPVAVTRVTLVGHGMGGVVVRAAVNHASVTGSTWPHLVREMVSLGVPQSGNAAEKAQQLSVLHLPLAPRPSGSGRTSPVTAIRRATVSNQGWTDPEVTDRWGRDRIALAPLPRADHHFLMTEFALVYGTSLGIEVQHPEVAEALIAWVRAERGRPRALAR